jgi:hypothetical protein
MEPATLVRIDRVLGKTKALFNAAALTENAEDAYQEFWRRMQAPFQRFQAGDSDAYCQFAAAYDDFRAERETMPAIVLDLKDIGYSDAEGIRTQYTALEDPKHWAWGYQWAFEQLHPSESERAEALARATAWIQEHEGETDWQPPGLLVDLLDFEHALLKARAFVQKLMADEQIGPWSEPDSPSRWAKRFKISARSFIRHVEKGIIRARKLSDKSYQVALADIPKPQASPRS